MHQYKSQIPPEQDRFVSEVMKFKKDGFFVDIGAHHHEYISNTFFLEKELNWRGLAVDIDGSMQSGWLQHRPNSKFVLGDATSLDYQKLLDEMNAPKIIDYLTVDLEPPRITPLALLKILETNYEFRIITFEIDAHRGDLSPMKISRDILPKKGYTRIETLTHPQDDFWVNYKHLDVKITAHQTPKDEHGRERLVLQVE